MFLKLITKNDPYIMAGNGLSEIKIKIHPQIDCQEYRIIIKILRDTIPKKLPTTVALDLPKSKYNDPIYRDK